jgi:hypothetical protein
MDLFPGLTLEMIKLFVVGAFFGFRVIFSGDARGSTFAADPGYPRLSIP